ncbi:hypothetical protein GCM10011318_19860 [Phaeocystidibacter marisrubri]|nr:hypothetical protein GCM10011318_19860 [Phaeocystidibacter marisrubri]
MEVKIIPRQVVKKPESISVLRIAIDNTEHRIDTAPDTFTRILALFFPLVRRTIEETSRTKTLIKVIMESVITAPIPSVGF